VRGRSLQAQDDVGCSGPLCAAVFARRGLGAGRLSLLVRAFVQRAVVPCHALSGIAQAKVPYSDGESMPTGHSLAFAWAWAGDRRCGRACRGHGQVTPSLPLGLKVSSSLSDRKMNHTWQHTSSRGCPLTPPTRARVYLVQSEIPVCTSRQIAPVGDETRPADGFGGIPRFRRCERPRELDDEGARAQNHTSILH